MENTNFDEFMTECQRIIDKYVGVCKKNYDEKKSYNFIADSIITSWFKRYMAIMLDLEILKQFTIGVKENEEYARADEDKKMLINYMIDNLNCISLLDGTIMSIVREIINKIKAGC